VSMWTRNPASQTSRSKVIQFKSYCSHPETILGPLKWSGRPYQTHVRTDWAELLTFFKTKQFKSRHWTSLGDIVHSDEEPVYAERLCTYTHRPTGVQLYRLLHDCSILHLMNREKTARIYMGVYHVAAVSSNAQPYNAETRKKAQM